MKIFEYQISDKLKEKIVTSTTKIATAISKAQQEISSIKEYREAIITAAITGQINLTDPK